MPIVQLAVSNPFVDGRQSDRALQVRTGAERYFTEHGHATLPELTLASGRRADLVVLSAKGQVTIVEIKSSIADLQADNKWPDYRADCDQLVFATLADVPDTIFPQDAGLMVCDAYGADMLRDAPHHAMKPARRRDVQLRFARAAAHRLARCCAHAGMDATGFCDD